MKKRFLLLILPFIWLASSPAVAQTDIPWPMPGHDAERSSRTTEEVRGAQRPVWYRNIEPYINYKTQVIAAEGKLFVATAKGLYAFSASDGSQLWVYPTLLPLGNAPTYANGVLYVGGLDRRVHAINAVDGKLKIGWSFYDAGAGYESNPVVANNTVYIGNRDGKLYAFDAGNGLFKWSFSTGGPIRMSAAYKNNTLYFAANDGYAYAVNTSGQQVWKSAKLLGEGFDAYWPVIYNNWVVFQSDWGYRFTEPYSSMHTSEERIDIFGADINGMTTLPNGTPVGPVGTAAGNWPAGTRTIDTSKPSVTTAGSTTPVATYYENKPWRRTVFYLDLNSGAEYTFDWDKDGKQEYPPLLFDGTHSGNRYPPVIGSNGVIYQAATTDSNNWIPRARIVGWQPGTPYISIQSPNFANDEPVTYSVGGNVIYYSLCCDREAGAFDIGVVGGSEWSYYSYNLYNLAPGYTQGYYANDMNGWGLFGTVNGIYGKHGAGNPPIPYQGKVYMLRGNSLMAFNSTGGASSSLGTSATVTNSNTPSAISATTLQTKLEDEVKKMISAGHMQPGFLPTSIGDYWMNRKDMGDYFEDYWKNPAETLEILSRTLPFLSAATQNSLKTYLQQEYTAFPPYSIVHIGWRDGVQREAFTRKPEVESERLNFGPRTSKINTSFSGWNFPPQQFYGMWKYAQVMGGAKTIFDAAKLKLENPPADTYLQDRPYVNNAYIAGYRGYLELENMAGYTTSISNSSKYSTYRHLVDLRINNFNKDAPYVYPEPAPAATGLDYNRMLNVSRNFMFLTRELADEMKSRIPTKIQQAVDEYERIAPAWFVNHYDVTAGEGMLDHLYTSHALYQAKAMILKEPYNKLSWYIDTPAFARGDLYYIDNLAAALEAYGTTPIPTATGTPTTGKPGDANGDGIVDGIDYIIWLNHYYQAVSGSANGDFDGSGWVDGLDYVIWLNNYGR